MVATAVTTARPRCMLKMSSDRYKPDVLETSSIYRVGRFMLVKKAAEKQEFQTERLGGKMGMGVSSG